MECPHCKGSGKCNNKMHDCGSGFLDAVFGVIEDISTSPECPDCGGEITVIGDCPHCDGSGEVDRVD